MVGTKGLIVSYYKLNADGFFEGNEEDEVEHLVAMKGRCADLTREIKEARNKLFLLQSKRRNTRKMMKPFKRTVKGIIHRVYDRMVKWHRDQHNAANEEMCDEVDVDGADESDEPVTDDSGDEESNID